MLAQPAAVIAAPPPQSTTEPPQKVLVHSLDEIFSMAKSTHWATREECFEQLILHLEPSSPPGRFHGALLGDSTHFANLLASHIDDAHYKVSQAALQTAINAISIEALAVSLSNHLHLLIPSILNQVSERSGGGGGG